MGFFRTENPLAEWHEIRAYSPLSLLPITAYPSPCTSASVCNSDEFRSRRFACHRFSYRSPPPVSPARVKPSTVRRSSSASTEIRGQSTMISNTRISGGNETPRASRRFLPLKYPSLREKCRNGNGFASSFSKLIGTPSILCRHCVPPTREKREQLAAPCAHQSHTHQRQSLSSKRQILSSGTTAPCIRHGEYCRYAVMCPVAVMSERPLRHLSDKHLSRLSKLSRMRSHVPRDHLRVVPSTLRMHKQLVTEFVRPC